MRSAKTTESVASTDAERSARAARVGGRVPTPELRLRDALGLPTFEVAGLTLYRRLASVAERGRNVKVFYPVFRPTGTPPTSSTGSGSRTA